MKNLRSHLDNNGNMVVWLYNPYGRREIDDIVSIERQLSANLAIEERLGVVKMLKKHLTSPMDERQSDLPSLYRRVCK